MAIRYFHLSQKNDAELIAKLNAVAEHEKRKPHDMGKLILEEHLDEMIASCHINVTPLSQLASAG